MPNDELNNSLTPMATETKIMVNESEDEGIVSLSIYLPASQYREMAAKGVGFEVTFRPVGEVKNTTEVDLNAFRSDPALFLRWMAENGLVPQAMKEVKNNG